MLLGGFFSYTHTERERELYEEMVCLNGSILLELSKGPITDRRPIFSLSAILLL